MNNVKTHNFASREELAAGLSQKIAEVLSRAISTKGSAFLAVSGGSTPKMLFRYLSGEELDWSKVNITLVDERWVNDRDERSNAKLVAEHLLVNKARQAKFHPLYREGEVDEQLPVLEADFHKLSFPIDVVILGMGTDGHTASFFPGGDNLAKAVDPNGSDRFCSMRAAGAGEPRVTFALPSLMKAGLLALHFEGEEKLGVFKEAQKPGEADLLPIRHVLCATDQMELFWAP